MKQTILTTLVVLFAIAVAVSLRGDRRKPVDEVRPSGLTSLPSVARNDLVSAEAVITFPSGYTFTAAVADTDVERAQGLSYRPFPQSMLFVFDVPTQPSFWMKDMNFALDLIWLTEGKVVGIVENVEPEYPAKTFYTPAVPIDMALEVPSGTVKKAGLHVGDALDITFKRQ